MVDWIIYYDDGGSWTNENGAWSEAPSRGVECVAFDDRLSGHANVYDLGRRYEHGRDYYLWPPEFAHPICCDLAGLYDYLERIESPLAGLPLTALTLDQLAAESVKIGRYVPHHRWRRLLEEFEADPRLRRKSAFEYQPDGVLA